MVAVLADFTRPAPLVLDVVAESESETIHDRIEQAARTSGRRLWEIDESLLIADENDVQRAVRTASEGQVVIADTMLVPAKDLPDVLSALRSSMTRSGGRVYLLGEAEVLLTPPAPDQGSAGVREPRRPAPSTGAGHLDLNE